jgi:hypothetical protein
VALPPYPVAPNPITWGHDEIISTARLAADPGNAALLFANRPLFVGAQSTTGQGLAASTVVPLQIDTEDVDAWAGHQIPQTGWDVPLLGVYLAEGDVECSAFSANTSSLTAGIQSTANGTVTSSDGGKVMANGVSNPGATCADLIQLSPATSDSIALYGECFGQAGTVAIARGGAKLKAEWVGLPATGPGRGTVVASPQPAALWPPGAGTNIVNVAGIPAGATSVRVTDTTGMVVGGWLGLDWYLGQMVTPVAEAVTITSISGTTIGISATAFSHAPGAPVSLPVSAAFMNQQVRDAINFLAYPPMACLDTFGTSASLATSTFPAGSALTFIRANIDNFSAWNSGSGWVAPVAGIYYVFGQVYLATQNTYTLAAGVRVNSGTVMWGTGVANQSTMNRTMCATFRRHLRLNAGDTVQLFGSQNSGSSIGLSNVAGQVSKLITVFRRF